MVMEITCNLLTLRLHSNGAMGTSEFLFFVIEIMFICFGVCALCPCRFEPVGIFDTLEICLLIINICRRLVGRNQDFQEKTLGNGCQNQYLK